MCLQLFYHENSNNVKNKIITDKYLTYETFIKITKRFNELSKMVDKVNEMTCDLVAVSMIIALASLCMTIYSTILNSGKIIGWIVNMTDSILTVTLLLPQAMLLNEKVKHY